MSFLTHTSENVLWMSSSLLDGSGVRHGFSTRVGGVSPAILSLLPAKHKGTNP